MSNSCPLPAGSKVIGYLRVSSEVQKEKGTIAGQVEELERYVAEHRLSLAHPPFIDEAKPGSSTAPRDGFQDMIAFAHQEPRPCDGIIFWSWARFARDQDDAHFFKADLRRRGYTLISLSDGIPQDTGMDYVMESLIHWKDEEYSRQLSKNTKRGLHLLARHGYAPGGFPPKGYKAQYVEVDIGGKRRRVAKWVPDPEWAPLVDKAWEMRANGATYEEILDATGLFTTQQGLTAHFRRKTYLGYRLCGDLEIPNAHEPLVTPELWHRVQSTLDDSSSPRRRRRRYRSPHLLSGLLTCAFCGANIHGRTYNDSTHRAYKMYLCSTKSHRGYRYCESKPVPAGRLDSAILDIVVNRMLSPDIVNSLLAEINSQLEADQQSQRIAQLEQRLRSVERAIANLLNLAEKAGKIGEVALRIKQRQREKDQLQLQLRAAQNQRPVQITQELLERLLDELRQPLADGSLAAQRSVLHSLIDQIVVQRRRAELYYRPPSAVLFPTLGWE